MLCTAEDGVHGWELWHSDGAPAGTVLVSDIAAAGRPDPQELTAVDATMLFSTRGVLWRRDGALMVLRDIRARGRRGDPPAPGRA